MYQRTKYFSDKFIRNGIGGCVISVVLIYNSIRHDKSFHPITLLMPLIAILWLYFGIRINKKLKAREYLNDNDEISGKKITFKEIDFFLLILLFAIVFLGPIYSKYANFLTIPVLLVYTFWFHKQMKLINTFLNS